jgi:large subunit ribosomal protein L21
MIQYKNKSGYRRRLGHRQRYTQVRITGIGTEAKPQSAKAQSAKPQSAKAQSAKPQTAKAQSSAKPQSKAQAKAEED